jgi:hypothetical protein
MAKNVWRGLTLTDHSDATTAMQEGYRLSFDGSSLVMGCTAVDFAQAGDKAKGGQRACLVQAAKSLAAAAAAAQGAGAAVEG